MAERNLAKVQVVGSNPITRSNPSTRCETSPDPAAGLGLCVVAIAKALGAGEILVFADNNDALELAEQLGATRTDDVGNAESVISSNAPGGVDHLFECQYEYKSQERVVSDLLKKGRSAYLLGWPGTE